MMALRSRLILLVALASLATSSVLAQQQPPAQGPGCGGEGQPPCGGCSDCPPPCPGAAGPGDGQDVTAPSLEFAASAANARFGGQAVLVAGVANDVTLQASNPLRASFTGAFDLVPRGATLNVTHVPLTLAAGEKRLVPVRITPQADQQGFNVQGRVLGTSNGSALCTQINFGTQVVPAVSIDWVSPAPARGMATVESLTLRNGGFGGGDVALGSARSVVVRATNLGNATSRPFYAMARVNDATLAPVPVPALVPGATSVLDLGAIPPPPPDCNGPVARAGCGGGTFVSVSVATKPDATGGPSAVAFTVANGRVATTPAPLMLNVVDPDDIMPILEGAPSATLGKPYVVTLNVTNHGGASSDNALVQVAFVPPFRAQYDVQSEALATFLVSTPAGGTRARSATFTPLISGRWEMLVSFVPSGDVCCAVNAFTVDVAGPVNVSVPSSSVPVVPIGQSARTPILVRSSEPLADATLRITTAPEATLRREGPPSASAGQAVLGGLSQTLVKAEPTSVPLGTLAPGVDVWSNVTVTARASGVYNVVPYVVSSGYAYTGAPLPADAAPSAAPPPYSPQFTIAFKVNDVPLALAWAPALGVLVLGAASFVGRRFWIK